jgi:hypothetical protein
MKNTYESCGKIDVANKKTIVFTYLPNLNVNFRFTNFYNVSTSTRYGIVGILVNEGKNLDFSTFPSQLSPIPGEINLKNLDFRFSKFGFNELTNEDQITFFCLHDDEFNNVNLTKNEIDALKKLQSELSQFGKASKNTISEITIDEILTSLETTATGEPKAGNGGILTVDGSCIL